MQNVTGLLLTRNFSLLSSSDNKLSKMLFLLLNCTLKLIFQINLIFVTGHISIDGFYFEICYKIIYKLLNQNSTEHVLRVTYYSVKMVCFTLVWQLLTSLLKYFVVFQIRAQPQIKIQRSTQKLQKNYPHQECQRSKIVYFT